MAPGARRGNGEHQLGGAPRRARQHRAPMAGEPHQGHVAVRAALAHQLAQVDHPLGGHAGGSGIAHVGVVGPHQALGPRPQVAGEPIHGGGHVPVPDVPGLAVATDHDPVVLLGAGRHHGVLLRVERLLGIARGVVGASTDGRQQLDHLGFTRGRHQSGGPGVLVGILAVGHEALPGLQRRRQRIGGVALQPADDPSQRVPQRVHVEAVEADPRGLGARPRSTRAASRGSRPPPRLAHIQVGQRSKAPRMPRASRSWSSWPRTHRLIRQQSGQSPSTPIQVNPCSSMRRRLSRPASGSSPAVPWEASPRQTRRVADQAIHQRIQIGRVAQGAMPSLDGRQRGPLVDVGRRADPAG